MKKIYYTESPFEKNKKNQIIELDQQLKTILKTKIYNQENMDNFLDKCRIYGINALSKNDFNSFYELKKIFEIFKDDMIDKEWYEICTYLSKGIKLLNDLEIEWLNKTTTNSEG